MPNHIEPEVLKEADAAVKFAQTVRERHRRRTERGSASREADIENALTRLRDAMRPLRSEIGRFAYGPATERAESNRQKIRDASDAIQRERRKLFKMKSRKTRSGYGHVST